MRQWVEKLANLSKNEGIYYEAFTVIVKDIRWSAIKWDSIISLNIKLTKEGRADSIKIYEDEYDLLKSTTDYLKKANQDYIIEKLNNL
jgi:hypothetical protein